MLTMFFRIPASSGMIKNMERALYTLILIVVLSPRQNCFVKAYDNSTEKCAADKDMMKCADILNVWTITTSGCVKQILTGVNLVLQKYGVLSYIFFVSILHSFCVKIQANEGKK